MANSVAPEQTALQDLHCLPKNLEVLELNHKVFDKIYKLMSYENSSFVQGCLVFACAVCTKM